MVWVDPEHATENNVTDAWSTRKGRGTAGGDTDYAHLLNVSRTMRNYQSQRMNVLKPMSPKSQTALVALQFKPAKTIVGSMKITISHTLIVMVSTQNQNEDTMARHLDWITRNCPVETTVLCPQL
jgi:hypothetical protein